MATIGQSLLQPASGWRRYNDDNSNFTYVGNWRIGSSKIGWSNLYEEDCHYSKTINDKIQFNFIGTKLRIIATKDNVYNVGGSWDIYIDGEKVGSYSNPKDYIIRCCLLYEITGLDYKEHFVELVVTDATGLKYGANFDVVDIDENGELLPYRKLSKKYFLKTDSNIYTIDENKDIVQTDLTEPLLRDNFKEFGFTDLSLILDKELANTKLLINIPESEIQPKINTKVIPHPQLILPTGDIYLKMLDKIHNFTIYSNKNQCGDIKIVFSVDSGNTWQTYNSENQEFEKVDISNMAEIKEKGIESDTFNTIGEKWNNIVTVDKIRFAYYLEIDTINDIAEVDKLEVKIDMHGRWRKAEHIEDYDYEYDNEHIYVSFFKDGSYKINYQE